MTEALGGGRGAFEVSQERVAGGLEDRNKAVAPWPPKEGPNALRMFLHLGCLEKGPGFSCTNEMAPQLRECLGKPKRDVKNF